MNKNVKTQAIIQARLGSSRLPGKTMMQLAGKPVIEHVCRRVSAAFSVDRVVVATTSDPKDDALCAWCRDNGILFFRGSEEDVLSRFLGSIEEFPCDNLLRITADCPLVDPGLIDALVNLFEVAEADYASNVFEPTFPVGFDLEILKASVLQELAQKELLKSHREHVTLYIRENLHLFKTASLTAKRVFSNFRVTLDYKEDFEVIAAIYKHFGSSDGLFSYYQIIDYLKKHSDVASINSSIDRFDGLKRSLVKENREMRF
ncbi:MAG: NTP transferase domain-containing protein [Candidatus Riflebacteria bacterium]|nr:NTP transferase domain-containing protein [Candidatus Riflebacteria bacterium]